MTLLMASLGRSWVESLSGMGLEQRRIEDSASKQDSAVKNSAEAKQ